MATRTPTTQLSGREREVLGWLQTTMTAGEIAAALHISQNTLKSHVKAIYRKLGVENRRDAARLARSQGFQPATPRGRVR